MHRLVPRLPSELRQSTATWGIGLAPRIGRNGPRVWGSSQHESLARSRELLASTFTRAFAAIDLQVEAVEGGLLAIYRSDRKRGVVVGHPLWRHDEQSFNEIQAVAYDSVVGDLGVAEVSMTDAWVLQRIPAQVYQHLAQGA